MTAPLYASILGDARADLALPVEKLHTTSRRAVGVFRVRRGEGLLARLLGWVLRLPGAQERVGIELSVERGARDERWERRFGGHLLRSVQWGEGGVLIEEMNLVQCCFRLHAEGGALRFEQVGAKVGVRGFTVPLPRFLWPRVEGRAEGVGGEVAVDVRIHGPIVGLLVAYEGRVTPEDA